MNADDFRDYMLSFLFLRYLSFNYEEAAGTTNNDNTYTETLEYLGKENVEFNGNGTIEWDKSGNVITLVSTKGEKQMYKVREGSIVKLDTERNEIRGSMASKYILNKK